MLPSYATHFCGAGGLVLNDAGEVLLIKEVRRDLDTYFWKIPGGLVEHGETLQDAVVREVKEESGIDAEVTGILGVKEMRNFKFGCSDLYFIFMMKAVGGELKPQTEENIIGAKFVTHEEIEKNSGRTGMIL